MKTLKPIILILIIVLNVYITASVYKNAGSAGAEFMKLSIGPRPLSLGNAYTALGDDINSIFYNPAGLNNIQDISITAMYNKYFEDVYGGMIAGSKRLTEKDILGFATILYNIEDIKGYNLQREFTGNFGAKNSMTIITYSTMLYEDVLAGISGKFIYEKIENHSGIAAAFDFGVIYKNELFNVGLIIKNGGTRMKLKNEGYNLPLEVRVGGNYLFKNIYMFSLDISKTIDQNVKFSFGTEITPIKYVICRVGYEYDLSGFDAVASYGVSGGIGIAVRDFRLDYAICPTKYFGITHQVSLTYNFSIFK